MNNVGGGRVNSPTISSDNSSMKKILGFLVCLVIFTGCASKNAEVIPGETFENGQAGETLENLDGIVYEEPNEAQPEENPEETTEIVQKYTLRVPEGEPVRFKETWGYVMEGREDEYIPESPITDVCYFSADINCYGELSSVPVRSRLKTGKARCHLVIACESRAATHLALNPQFETRKQILKDIVRAAGPYDGVQLDLEYIPARDRKHFITFIGDLRYMLKGKPLSVCVPARFKRGSEDTYPYADIALYCDRVFVMCYDEHWSTSRPGAVASPEWCSKVLAYAQAAIPSKKLVMGIPLYGRTWASETTAGAWYNSGANRIMREHGVEEVVYEDDIPSFKYTANVDVTGYFNDTWSVLKLCRMYEEAGVQSVGFWRLGQESEDLWDWVKVR